MSSTMIFSKLELVLYINDIIRLNFFIVFCLRVVLKIICITGKDYERYD